MEAFFVVLMALVVLGVGVAALALVRRARALADPSAATDPADPADQES